MARLDGKARALGEWRAYLTAAAISSIAAVAVLELWKADLHVPFDYGGDALSLSLVVKSVVDHGWFWSFPKVGAPFGLELYDCPFTAHDSFHLFLIKLMSVFSGDWALLYNLYFLLGFPLTTLSAMAVFRYFRVGHGPATVGSVLYSFLPTRLLAGEAHLFLDVFYQVPLAILVVLWVCGEHPPLVRDRGAGRWPMLEVRRGRSWGALLICALTSSTSLYYAFFTVCLLVAGGLWASFERRSLRNAVAGVGLASVIVVGLVANGLPTIVYHARHGPNAEVTQRRTGEAEVYGMKIAQLLLPVDGHRVAALRQLKRRYTTSAPLVGENGTTSLGIVGDVGFLALLGIVLFGRQPERPFGEVLRPLAVLNLMAVLLGTIGGFGSLIAVLVSPQIRTYSRLAVFIGFFALFAVVILLDWLRSYRTRLGELALPVVLGVGLLDQVSLLAIRSYANVGRAYASDADIVRRIEAAVPSGTAIFELPYMSYPEGASVHHMSGYDLIRPYLHSHTLRWSFPAIRGRSGDIFVHDVSQREPSKILETLAAAGFGGILIDRDGYVDAGSAIEASFRTALEAEPLVSEGSRLVFFNLADYSRRAHTDRSPAELDVVLHPLAFTFTNGFYGIEREPNRTFRWCKSTGEILVENDTTVSRKVSIRMTLGAARPPARLTVAGDLLSESVDLVGPVPFVREIDVSPGGHVIRFACNGGRAEAPDDTRTLVWQLENFAFDELRASSLKSH